MSTCKMGINQVYLNADPESARRVRAVISRMVEALELDSTTGAPTTLWILEQLGGQTVITEHVPALSTHRQHHGAGRTEAASVVLSVFQGLRTVPRKQEFGDPGLHSRQINQWRHDHEEFRDAVPHHHPVHVLEGCLSVCGRVEMQEAYAEQPVS